MKFHGAVFLILALGFSSQSIAKPSNFTYSIAGMRISRNLGNFVNGCTLDGWQPGDEYCVEAGQDTEGNPLVVVEDPPNWPAGSRAAQTCAAIGGHLPTKPEMEKMIRSFKLGSEYHEENFGPRLDEAGMAKMAALLNESVTNFKEELFWSSSVNQFNRLGAYVFGGNRGRVLNYNRFINTVSVRCISN